MFFWWLYKWHWLGLPWITINGAVNISCSFLVKNPPIPINDPTACPRQSPIILHKELLYRFTTTDFVLTNNWQNIDSFIDLLAVNFHSPASFDPRIIAMSFRADPEMYVHRERTVSSPFNRNCILSIYLIAANYKKVIVDLMYSRCLWELCHLDRVWLAWESGAAEPNNLANIEEDFRRISFTYTQCLHAWLAGWPGRPVNQPQSNIHSVWFSCPHETIIFRYIHVIIIASSSRCNLMQILAFALQRRILYSAYYSPCAYLNTVTASLRIRISRLNIEINPPFDLSSATLSSLAESTPLPVGESVAFESVGCLLRASYPHHHLHRGLCRLRGEGRNIV